MPISQDLVELLPEQIDALIMDFDGVFTDNGVYLDQNGIETVRCNRMDGLGLNLLAKAGLPMLVLSKEKNPVVAARCKKLRLPCLQGIDDKAPALLKWLEEFEFDVAKTIYIGNDINDIPCLRVVGCPVVVADAHDEVKPLARIVLSKPGGHGALRELSDMIRIRMGAANPYENA